MDIVTRKMLLQQNSTNSHFFIARQPLYDRQLKFFGYELLYRSGPDQNTFPKVCDNWSTASVLDISLTKLGMPSLVEEHTAFINQQALQWASMIYEQTDPG